MKRIFRISTTALCTVSVSVEAASRDEAIAKAPRRGSAWRVGDVFGDVELDDGDMEVEEVGAANADDLADGDDDDHE